jgi:hypothetical protein
MTVEINSFQSMSCVQIQVLKFKSMEEYSISFTRVYVHSTNPDEMKFIQEFENKSALLSVKNWKYLRY